MYFLISPFAKTEVKPVTVASNIVFLLLCKAGPDGWVREGT